MALSLQGGSTAAPSNPSGKAVDVVAVLRMDTSAQVFGAARPMRSTVFERSQLMEHPLEDGAKIADHKVKEPTEIDLPLFIQGAPELPEIFDEIRQLYTDGILLTVQTRAATYASMLILEMPHEEAPDTIGSLTIGLRLREARFVKAVYGGIAPKSVAGKDKPKASTVKRGAQQTTATTAPQTAKAGNDYKGSTLYRLTRKGK